MNSWLRSALRVGMFAAGAADAALASENDKPAAPNAGRALLLRFRVDGCFTRDMVAAWQDTACAEFFQRCSIMATAIVQAAIAAQQQKSRRPRPR